MRRRHRRFHRTIWTALAVILPLVILATLTARRTGPLEVPSVRIAAPA
jgi:hypothetical protein